MVRFPRLWLWPAMLVLLLGAGPSFAGDVVNQVAADLAPLSGYVVKVVGEEILIDQDAQGGVRPGDLFSVAAQGEPVVHPVTGEVIGHLDRDKGVVQVSQVKSGFSFARVLQDGAGIVPGDIIRRFENIEARLLAYVDGRQQLQSRLQQALPELKWIPFEDAQKDRPAQAQSVQAPSAGLVLVHDKDGLTLHLPGGVPPRHYAGHPFAEVREAVSPAAVVVSRPEPEAGGLRFGPRIRGSVAGVAVGDFDGDGRNEVATLLQQRLLISRMEEGAFRPVGELDLGAARKALAIDGADLDGDGRVELYVTAAWDLTLDSLVVRYGKDGYAVAEKGLSWAFRRVAWPGRGEMLLAQRLGADWEDFSGPVFRVGAKGGAVSMEEKVEIPDGFSLYGFTPLGSQGKFAGFAQLTGTDKLRILGVDGQLLWEGDDRFGGSEIYMERPDPSRSLQDQDTTRNAYLPGRLVIGQAGEILVPANEGSRFFVRGRSYKKHQLRAMAWEGQVLRETWHTRTLEGYLADFQLADADNDGRLEVVMAIAFPWAGFSGKRQSAVALVDVPQAGGH